MAPESTGNLRKSTTAGWIGFSRRTREGRATGGAAMTKD
jgi:hypothetical protein